MPAIISVAEVVPPFELKQEKAAGFARELFSNAYKDIERLMTVFHNGQIEKRHFVNPLEWFYEKHTFAEKNQAYIESAVKLGKKAIKDCLCDEQFLKKKIPFEEIDAIFYISSTGISTPSIEAKIMNELPFHKHTKRVPIWGLGCAGGAAGLSRAYEYCLAFPQAKVLVLSVELCSLTFQNEDLSKSNLIGTSLFADGVACALLCGDAIDMRDLCRKSVYPTIMATQSTLMPDSLDVMGWELKNAGLYVIFSRDIPRIIESWLKPNVTEFLQNNGMDLEKIDYFIAHPGGKKVLDAYENSLGVTNGMTAISREVLKQYGNMSSATIFYVLRRYMEQDLLRDTFGLCAALGPGFSSELLLMRWN
ncbi:type III polyketide synthase [Bacillus sp. BRMEA1]|uniref:type III polyketide synthase n=1 Tax=Neobacillus endophyticus TaxID=2738405 RepID=UPI001565DA48|nr:3-oxoacyl-[acyl-carrier-protein] synthase III C-terminal domain-containing protein [Neobacillus endophyticus]NRD80516.1 type III polyketide synthase [Neobacillus endophyticus]